MEQILIPNAALPPFAGRVATLMPVDVVSTFAQLPSWGSAPSTDAGSHETRRVRAVNHSYVSTTASTNDIDAGGAAKQGAPPRREPR